MYYNESEGLIMYIKDQRAEVEYINNVRCPRCGEVYSKPELRLYVCKKCRFQERLEVARVRNFLDQNGEQSVEIMAGVLEMTPRQVEYGLQNLEIQNIKLQKRYHCNSCGDEISYGRYCDSCTQNTFMQIKTLFKPKPIQYSCSKRE